MRVFGCSFSVVLILGLRAICLELAPQERFDVKMFGLGRGAAGALSCLRTLCRKGDIVTRKLSAGCSTIVGTPALP